MAAIVNVCVDPRLNHELIRSQTRQRLEQMGLRTERIFLTSDVGGNIGSSFCNTAELLQRTGEAVVLAAVLHHDDCIAAQAGSRQALRVSQAAAQQALTDLGVQLTVQRGEIRTEDSSVTWEDEPAHSHEELLRQGSPASDPR